MLSVHSILVMGSNGGIGLKLVWQLAGESNGPECVFATCLAPEGPQAHVKVVVCKKGIALEAAGSNRGIGLELVRQLVGQSKKPEWIFATCRDPKGPRAQDLKNLADKHQSVKIIPMDTNDPSSVKAAAAQVTEKLQGAGLNLLINNAGIVKPGCLESETAEDMSEVYKTNVIGPMLVSQAFLPLLRKASQENPQKGMSCSKAAIVNMSSEAGSITNLLVFDLGHVLGYRCSKAALNMLTRCQSRGWAKDEILCIALHPGIVKTDMIQVDVPGMITTNESVHKILNTLGSLCEKDNGNFVNWEGKTLPW